MTEQLRLLEPIRIGDLQLANRIFMAPLTRCHASAGRVPNPLMRDYYVQRASAGLILSEATVVTPAAWATRTRPASGPPSRSRAGRLSRRPCMRRAGKCSSNSGTSAAFPIPATSAARCRLRRAPSRLVDTSACCAPSARSSPRAPSKPARFPHCRGLPQRRAKRAGRRLRWSGSPWRQWLPPRPVLAG